MGTVNYNLINRPPVPASVLLQICSIQTGGLFIRAATNKYTKVRQEQKPDDIEDNALYCDIVGPAWEKYLSAGGSRTMINF